MQNKFSAKNIGVKLCTKYSVHPCTDLKHHITSLLSSNMMQRGEIYLASSYVVRTISQLGQHI